MVDTRNDTRAAKTPWHLWVVGVVAVLFNAVGVYDYVMAKTQGAAYMASMGMTPAQIDYYAGFPFWMNLVWPLAVFAAFVASVLILLKNKLASPIFIASLALFLLTLVHHYVIAKAGDILGQANVISSVVIAAMLILFAFYSRAMAKRGVLR